MGSLVLLLMFGLREAQKRVECRLEEELVDRIDRLAELLKTNRTDIIRCACIRIFEKHLDTKKEDQSQN